MNGMPISEGYCTKNLLPEKAKRLLDKLEIHCVSKHVSWLNTVETGLNLISKQ